MTDTLETTNEMRELKVIGAGFGRTGTFSMKAALEELGFGPCYHMSEVFRSPGDSEQWEAAAKGEPVDWQKLLKGYQATVDWPGCTFYEELMHAYPDAKVVLNVRGPERWYESARNTIYQVSDKSARSLIQSVLFFWGMTFASQRRHAFRMINTLIWDGTFDGRFEDKEHAIAVFKEHIEEVKQRVPSEKLLVYDVKEGWEPLCAFLGVEVPTDKPFPHLNDQTTFVNRSRQWDRKGLVRLGGGALLIGGLLAVLWFFLRLVLKRVAREQPTA